MTHAYGLGSNDTPEIQRSPEDLAERIWSDSDEKDRDLWRRPVLSELHEAFIVHIGQFAVGFLGTPIEDEAAWIERFRRRLMQLIDGAP